MKYMKYMKMNKDSIINRLDTTMQKYKVQSVGTYWDCIVQKDNLDEFIIKLNEIGVLIEAVSFWCYVNPDTAHRTGCPHGMGGPKSIYYKGWYSEFQNCLEPVNDDLLEKIKEEYNKDLIERTNNNTLKKIYEILTIPFGYAPKEYIKDNECVVPGLCLLYPKRWIKRRN